MSSECLKLAREVSTNRPVSSALSENATAWITMSSPPHSSSRAKAASSEASSVTSTSSSRSDPTDSAKGATRLPKASP